MDFIAKLLEKQFKDSP